MRIGIAADHAGFQCKSCLRDALASEGHQVEDFGAYTEVPDDDYPDYVAPLARAVAEGKLDRGIAVCGSGVGACVVANKVPGVRAALIHEAFSARQGVEDDDINVMCLGSKVLRFEEAMELIRSFLSARFSGAERHQRRLAKVAELERNALSRDADSRR